MNVSGSRLRGFWVLLALPSLACGVDVAESFDPGTSTGDPDATAESPIVRGTAATGYERDRTLSVRTPQASPTVCSATILHPTMVLTARHCVTTDGKIVGPLAAANQVRFRLGGLAPGPATPDFCTGTNRNPSCARGEAIGELGGTAVDAVLVRLENPISLADDATNSRVPFVPLELRTEDSAYLNTNRTITGWGRNTCAGGTGTLRVGTATLVEMNTSGEFEGVTYNRLMKLAPGPSGQNTLSGDSGGPTWGSLTNPPSVIGVHTFGQGCTGVDTAKDGFDVSLLREVLRVGAALTVLTPASITRDLSSLSQVDLTTPAGNPNWIIRNGRLTQTENSSVNYALLASLAFQRIVPTEYRVSVVGSDDDDSGIVFNYWDANNNLRCVANEELDRVHLVARRNGTDTVLGTAPWFGDYATTVNFRVSHQRASATNTYPMTCEVSGGGASTVSVTGQFDRITAGRAGVYNDRNDETSYFNFQVNRI